MITVISPPKLQTVLGNSIFLGGSIEMGKAENWQQRFINEFTCPWDEHWQIFNPRRDDWDSSWEQDIYNDQFYRQVDWELTHLERVTHKVFYFASGTISPITLMELGKFGDRENTYVVCPIGYQRKGNVDVFCHRYRIPQFRSMTDVIKQIVQ